VPLLQHRTRPGLAIAHDYLTQRGGAERVVLVLARAFPDAPIYTTLYDREGTYPEFQRYDVRPSWGNRLGVLRRNHRRALPLLPQLSHSLVIDADVTVASSSGWAHGFRTSGRKIVYCYSPARWLYQPDVYLGDKPKLIEHAGLRAIAPLLKRWDRTAQTTADRYVSISSVVRDRVRQTYGRDSTVIPAPYTSDVDVPPEPVTDTWFEHPGHEAFLLTVSRLLPYKNVDAVVSAMSLRPNRSLVVVGAGPERTRLRQMAPGNVLFLENLPHGQMRWLYENCSCLVAASHEDFGLTPLEAAAHGKPSVVLGAGGYLDTMLEAETAVFFDSPTAENVASAIDNAAERTWDSATLQARAQVFSEDAFVTRIRQVIHEVADVDSQ
jgi:glycosyltransferase involved in cell wall biosynthesis